VKSIDGVTLRSTPLKEDQATYTVTGKIPHVDGLTNEKSQTAINQALEKIGSGQRDAFLKDMADFHPMTGSGMKSGLAVDYEMQTQTQHVISLLFRVSSYMAGAAHPNNFSISFTYDVDAGKEIALSDLFKPKSNYLTAISKLSVPKLIDLSKKRGTYYDQKEQEIKQGAGPVANNFRNFTIRNGTLVITFDPYQVGPYAEGDQQIAITRPEIISILSDEGRKLLSETQQTSSK
jgi:hypothetical protein